MAKTKPKSKSKPKAPPQRRGASKGAATDLDFVEVSVALNALGKTVGRGLKALVDAVDELTDAVKGAPPYTRKDLPGLSMADTLERTCSHPGCTSLAHPGETICWAHGGGEPAKEEGET